MSEKTTIVNESDRSMTKGELISYGLGGVAGTAGSQLKTSFSMYFMSNVAGLNIAGVSILSTFLLIWDAIIDPFVGGMADRTNTKRFGKYRPHMMFSRIAWALVTVMLFSVPNIPDGAKYVYYIGALLLWAVFYSQFTIPWQALNSAMTHDPQERNILLTARQYGGFIAGNAVGMFTLPIVKKVGGAKPGFVAVAMIVGAVMIVCGMLSARGARRVDYYNSLPTPPKVTLRQQLAVIFSNKAVICASLLLGAVTLINTTGSALSMYYLGDVVGDTGLKSTFSTISLFMSLTCIPFMPAILKKLGKTRTLFTGMGMVMIYSLVLAIFRENMTIPMIIAVNTVSSFGFTMSNVSVLAMIPDCTDYTELKHGPGQAGLVNSSVSLMKQFCSSLSTTIVGVGLAMANYAKDNVTQEAIDMIVNIKIAYPIILFIIVAIIIKIYPITPAYAKQMRAELKAKRAAAAAEEA